MNDLAQIDRIISEVNTLDEKSKMMVFHRMEELIEAREDNDAEITIESAFGLWSDRNITIETLREKSWKQA